MLNVKEEIRLFNLVKDKFIDDVNNRKIRGVDDVLPWLRTMLPADALSPDRELGFSSAEEEIDYVWKRVSGVTIHPRIRAILNQCREPGRGILPDEYASAARFLLRSLSQNKETWVERRASEIVEIQLTAMELEDKLGKMSFFDLMRYVREQHMCTRLGCTTCGCLPFRRLICAVGVSELERMITAVTPAEIEAEDPELWYEPMRLIIFFFSETGRLHCPLIRHYNKLRDECLAAMERRRNENLRKQEEIHLQAVARKEENRRAHAQRSQEARERYYNQLRNTDHETNENGGNLK